MQAYQANFCAECGNQIAQPRRRFRPRAVYFCAECAAQVRERWYVTPLLCLLAGALLGATFGFRRAAGNAPTQALAPVVSAQDTTVSLKPRPSVEAIATAICGAQTKKGTPCKHRVRPGLRCAQHQGMPSMLKDENPSEASQKPKTRQEPH